MFDPKEFSAMRFNAVSLVALLLCALLLTQPALQSLAWAQVGHIVSEPVSRASTKPDRPPGGGSGGVVSLTTTVTGQISQNTTWTAEQSPYLISAGLTVASGVRLYMGPDVIVKFDSQTAYLNVYGTLVADGSSSQPVVFTSIKDDEYGGDTNNDGTSTVPAAGNWRRVLLTSTSGNSTLSDVIMRYGGKYNTNQSEDIHNRGILDVQSSASITDATLTCSASSGFYVSGAVTPIFSRTMVTTNAAGASYGTGSGGTFTSGGSIGNTNEGFYLVGTSTPTITASDITGNYRGVWATSHPLPH